MLPLRYESNQSFYRFQLRCFACRTVIAPTAFLYELARVRLPMEFVENNEILELVVSIINFRTGALTIQCVESVLADLEGINVQIIVVDNLSGDGSAEEIKTWMAGKGPDVPVKLVLSERNSGFSGGHNQGISLAKADFYLVLNSDAVLRPGCLRTLLQAARAAPKAGLLAPRLEYEDGTIQTSCFRFATPASELIRGAATGPVTKLLSKYDMPLDIPPSPDQIGWASFACILLRSKMIEDLGPMDEGYFLYHEDADYCWRACKAGWNVQYVPDARVVHFRGGSAPVKLLAAARKRLPAYYYAARTRFFYKCYGWSGLIAANLLWHTGRAIAQTRRLVGKPVPKPSALEWRDVWINALSPLSDHGAPEE